MKLFIDSERNPKVTPECEEYIYEVISSNTVGKHVFSTGKPQYIPKTIRRIAAFHDILVCKFRNTPIRGGHHLNRYYWDVFKHTDALLILYERESYALHTCLLHAIRSGNPLFAWDTDNNEEVFFYCNKKDLYSFSQTRDALPIIPSWPKKEVKKKVNRKIQVIDAVPEHSLFSIFRGKSLRHFLL